MTRTEVPVVRKQVVVNAPLEQAFTAFTERFGDFKPPEHNLLAAAIAETVFEAHVGGHIYDRAVDGSECRWARILAYEPPARVVFSWDISPQWQVETDPELTSEVEVRFVAEGPDRTRVDCSRAADMAPTIASTVVDRPAAEVFAYTTDPTRFHEWQQGVIDGHLEQPGPARVGTKCLTTRRIGRANRAVTSELTHIDAPRTWGVQGIDGPIRATVDVTVEPLTETSSRLTIAVDFGGHGIGKLLVPLIVRRQSQKEMPANVKALKRRVEAGPTGVSTDQLATRDPGGRPAERTSAVRRPAAGH